MNLLRGEERSDELATGRTWQTTRRADFPRAVCSFSVWEGRFTVQRQRSSKGWMAPVEQSSDGSPTINIRSDPEGSPRRRQPDATPPMTPLASAGSAVPFSGDPLIMGWGCTPG